jgi:hypothetical protein
MLDLSRTAVVRGGVVAMAGGATVIALSVPALAAIPHVKVSPSKKLTNNQVVKVSVTHFPANTAVTIIECNDNGDGDLANCNTAGEKQTTTTSKGTIKALPFTIKAGTIGNGTCGTSSADRFCYIAALASSQMQATTISFR